MGPLDGNVITRNETWTLWTDFFRKALSNPWNGNIKVWRADIKKTPPFIPMWRKFNLTYIHSEFCAPKKMKREKTHACPQGTYYIKLSFSWLRPLFLNYYSLPSAAYSKRDWMVHDFWGILLRYLFQDNRKHKL